MQADRLPPLDPAAWTDAQRAAAEEIIAGPRGALISPFVPMLRSPELTTHAQRMGEYLRYRSALGLRLSELAILVTSAHWSQQVEWTIHVPIALKQGVALATVQAIARRETPTGLPEDERVVHAFCSQLLRAQRVDDATWAEAVALLGEQGVVDLTGVCGYYAFLAMMMNAARTPAPPEIATVVELPQG
jgi:4-carboxymuconolactone decarboxylase